MPSSYTSSARFTLQATGENLNTWGAILNSGVFQLVDTNINGRTALALDGTPVTLTTANGATDQARAAMLDLTGSGPTTITIPSVSKTYDVDNGSSGLATFTTGSGSTAVLQAGEVCRIKCDGTNCKRVQGTDFVMSRITNVGAPLSNQDAATKKYVDDTAFSAGSSLPGQTGNSGKFLTTNGTTASWAAPTIAQISDYASDQTAREVASLYFMRTHRR